MTKHPKTKTKKFRKITVVIPCYNEERGIKQVIDGIPHKKLEELGYVAEVLVIDNNSTDKTAEIAKNSGARVIKEEKQGSP